MSSYGPDVVGLVERGENALFSIEEELRRTHPGMSVSDDALRHLR